MVWFSVLIAVQFSVLTPLYLLRDQPHLVWVVVQFSVLIAVQFSVLTPLYLQDSNGLVQCLDSGLVQCFDTTLPAGQQWPPPDVHLSRSQFHGSEYSSDMYGGLGCGDVLVRPLSPSATPTLFVLTASLRRGAALGTCQQVSFVLVGLFCASRSLLCQQVSFVLVGLFCASRSLL